MANFSPYERLGFDSLARRLPSSVPMNADVRAAELGFLSGAQCPAFFIAAIDTVKVPSHFMLICTTSLLRFFPFLIFSSPLHL